MAYRIRPDHAVDDEVLRIAAETLGKAVGLLADLHVATGEDLEKRVHQTRKRCKETRGLIRLVRPVLGSDEFRQVDRLVRDAARDLAGLRDAHATAAAVEKLRSLATADEISGLDALAIELGDAMTEPRILDEVAIDRAGAGLAAALERSAGWRFADSPESVLDGLHRTHREGRLALRALRRHDDDEHAHEWRKTVKYLWYQVRLVEPAAPLLLAPLVAVLDDLAEVLGDEHDLSVVARLVHTRVGDESLHPAQGGLDLVRRRQRELRVHAMRVGRSVYAERADAFVERVGSYLELSRRHGPESEGASPRATPSMSHEAQEAPTAVVVPVERERKYLIEPSARLDPDAAVVAGNPVTKAARIEQGYLAVDDTVSVRIRCRDGRPPILTIKAGSGARRTEVERALDPVEAEALWPSTKGRRVVKTRLDVPIDGHVATVDVFAGSLAGLVLVEVEFDDDETMAQFVAPPWFGVEVTDDPRYTNARLSVADAPPAAPSVPGA